MFSYFCVCLIVIRFTKVT